MCHVGPEDFGGCFEEPGSHGFANTNAKHKCYSGQVGQIEILSKIMITWENLTCRVLMLFVSSNCRSRNLMRLNSPQLNGVSEKNQTAVGAFLVFPSYTQCFVHLSPLGPGKSHGKIGKIHHLLLLFLGGLFMVRCRQRFSPSYGSSISCAFKKSWRRFEMCDGCIKKGASLADQDSPGQSVKFQWLMICQWGIHIETKPYIWGTKENRNIQQKLVIPIKDECKIHIFSSHIFNVPAIHINKFPF